jgi:hypothetical protein
MRPRFGTLKLNALAVTAALALAILASAGIARGQAGIVEKPNAPLAVTGFMAAKNPEVGTRIRLALFKLKVAPAVTQSFDRSKKSAGMMIKVTEELGGQPFTNAGVVLSIDGQSTGELPHEFWTPEQTARGFAALTAVEDADLVHRIAAAKEVYLSVLLPGTMAPFNQISFKLSAEQLANFKLLADKYDSLDPR